MDNGDKSWMGLRRASDEYIRGVNNFLDKAFELVAEGNQISCPCKKCANFFWRERNVVEEHLIVHGFLPGYTKWWFHGEGFSSRKTGRPSKTDEDSDMHSSVGEVK